MSLLLFISAVLGAQAGAYYDRPPSGYSDRMSRSLREYRDLVNCFASSEWAYAEPIFRTIPGSREEQAITNRILGTRNRAGTVCAVADYMRVTGSMLRGGIAGARYRLDFADAPVPAADTSVAPPPQGANFQWVGFNEESSRRDQLAFANCLAERETGAVHALLMTSIDTHEERAAWQALSRRFGSCLASGQTLRANPLTFRPWLAEARFQRARRALSAQPPPNQTAGQ